VPGDHNSTFGGNPVTSAAAVAALRYIIDNDIAGNAGRVGEYLMNKLKALKSRYGFITEVRGRGLLVAVEFNSDIAQKVLISCLEKRLLVNRVKANAIRLVPPLIIGRNEVDRAVSILDIVFSGIKE
jgi:acetylornithine/N-succinyldiaminopimelate aminotransferase